MPSQNKSIMRCLGEFVGHVVRGVKAKPSGSTRHEVRREEHVQRRGDVTLRRTVVDEVEFREPTDRP